ncbi:MAG: hypothetical protein ACKVXR_11905 [Planctomycetota bacterium]
MKQHLVAACIALAPALAHAMRPAAMQRGAPSNSLSRVVGVFTVCDADRDGKISAEESRAIPVTPPEFAKEDLDGDGSWSRDEFTLYYRGRLIAGGQTLGADLDAEVARIQALKRVRVVEEARKHGAEPAGGRVEAEPVRVRFEKALGELEQRVATRKAKPEDFRRLRNLVILNGRSAPESQTGSPASATNSKVLAALERMEKRATIGQFDREDFETLRTLIETPPPRGATPPAKAGSPPDAAGPVLGPADARRRASEPRATTPAGPKPVPRSDAGKPPTSRGKPVSPRGTQDPRNGSKP